MATKAIEMSEKSGGSVSVTGAMDKLISRAFNNSNQVDKTVVSGVKK
jgi:hypothetical protein